MALVLKLAGIGLATMIVNTVLRQSGKEDVTQIITLGSLIVGLGMVLKPAKELIEDVENFF